MWSATLGPPDQCILITLLVSAYLLDTFGFSSKNHFFQLEVYCSFPVMLGGNGALMAIILFSVE